MDGKTVTAALVECGVTYIVWIPDSYTGTWDREFSGEPGLKLIRVCREGEAFAVAAGLLLGGQRPIIFIQWTGFFEAGDSLRNFIHDCKLPLFFAVGLRNYYKYKEGTSRDSAPAHAERIMKAWDIPYSLLENSASAEELSNAYLRARSKNRAEAVFLAE